MPNHYLKPKETDNIDCHLQQIGMGSLICKAARQTGDNTTNEVDSTICFNCDVGKIFREVGCDAVTPKIKIYDFVGTTNFRVEKLFCKIQKRDTTFEYCKKCELVTAETTRRIVFTTRGLFEAQGFYSAYQDLEKARESIRDGNFDNAVTRSLSSLESTMRICHEKLGKPLPAKKQVTDLWKSTRELLSFEKMDASESEASLSLVNSLAGVASNLGGLRNSLGDAHGKGNVRPDVSESIAELALNTASTLSTLIIRRLNQLKEE
jgi:hypothetical protein